MGNKMLREEIVIDELKKLNPTQRHIFFEKVANNIPWLKFKKHPYENMQNIEAKNSIVCRDSFHNRMYLIELE